MTTRRDILQRIARAIEPLYGPREAALIARMTVSARSGISEAALLADPAERMELEGVEELAAELQAGRPVQYVLGRAEFCGLEFAVREGCLIPRPETEELVGNILRSGQRPRTLLDVGTGSGCIAIALKLRFPEAAVTAVDLSAEALAIARENGKRLSADIDFRQADALTLEETLAGPFELIVSNPPYIPLRERASMRPNVTRYEPHRALFVPDDDPLCFYRAILRAARRLLAPGGSLWFEVHETLAGETRALALREGFPNSKLLRDLNDKPRMLWSRR